MGVVTIAQLLIKWQADDELGAGSISRLGEIIGDRGVIGRGAQEHLQCQLFTKFVRSIPIMFLHFSKHAVVILGVGYHRD